MRRRSVRHGKSPLEFSKPAPKVLASMIAIRHIAGDEWVVEVRRSVITLHQVRVTQSDLDRFASGRAAEELLRESFQFLLEREPNTSILPSFELCLIGRYFPEYEDEIQARLSRKP